MNNVGVFGWIREGVRRAVLLGFSDAVEQIGAADDKDALHPQLQSLLRDAPPRLAGSDSRAVETTGNRGERKRLGRSLNQLQPRSGSGSAAQES